MNFSIRPEIIAHDDTSTGGERWFEARAYLTVPREITGKESIGISGMGDGALLPWAVKHLELDLVEKIRKLIGITITIEGEQNAIQS